ncbi:MAG TPA: cytochrome c biogenesis protein CcdA [Candidatus Saccharimonadales bacterium]|nr:cytochrome c biogenesis protein CcdA [Candidatus Saccharimonadales bacterium]
MIQLIILSFVAGVMTVLAPCILSFLPVIVGGSLVQSERKIVKPFIITLSLGASIVIFTLLLKFSTSLLSVPTQVWQVASGVIIISLGLIMLWPKLWETLGAKLNLTGNKLLGKAGKKRGLLGDILTGVALGPVFASCSPTYAFIVAAVLPSTFAVGLTYLVAYAAGLSAVLLLISLLGQKLVTKLNWASNPNGWFKKAIGIIFILVGIFIATGLDHKLQAFLVSQGWYDPFSAFEQSLL